MLYPPDIQSAHAENAAVDNDFHQTHAIFSLFEGLEADDLDKSFAVEKSAVNGHQSNDDHSPIANGAPKDFHK